MTRVINKKYGVPPGAIYIGRGSIWGNPYSHKQGTKATYVVNTREEAIQKYREYFLSLLNATALLYQLKDKTLFCYCVGPNGATAQDKPYVCHGQILAELADGLPDLKVGVPI